MEKSTIVVARKLANYIQHHSDLLLINPNECPYSEHIGALFTDVILQSGLNYNTIVAPRVNHVLGSYPNAFSVEKFSTVIESNGIENVLKWKHVVKIKRMQLLLEFCKKNNLNMSYEVKNFLLVKNNQKEFLKINGIGNKTLDYLLKLLNTETVAVDRHIFSFVEKAGIESKDYTFVKMIVEYAADIMDISRRTIDYSIWSYMSNLSQSKQLVFDFKEN